MARVRSRTFTWVQAPPRANMRRKQPKSAPRLFEWLVDKGYVEPVSNFRASRANRRAKRTRRN